PPLQPSAPERKPEAAARPAPVEQKVAIAAPPPSSAPASADSVKLRWPASGKIIAGFGSRADGTHNDGINLQVPLGTDVHAAESGVVAYSGSELKGYGNLVLLRHDNGWVTAYAHNDELLVKRGDKVRRGQVIAKAGKSGSVDQPQLHFELRQGSKPVDPIPYLERL
ncbi:MAG TPA: M23 family metallopeptidase, partial [Hyphomicrobium sp.]|nr:M23 family metallopeptidase [Hyphomicrobium sp.]